MAPGRGDARGRKSRNHLLASLSESEWDSLASYLVRVPLSVNQYLYRQGHSIDRVYFPESSFVSLVVTTSDGRSVEVGLVGSQGAAGVGVSNGSPMPCDVVVQVAGDALVLRLEDLPRGGAAERTLGEVLGRYTQALLAQTMQIAACNRLHSTRQRASRWILTMADRVGSVRLPLTHDVLATMIGVRRASISAVAGRLQHSGLIEYRHGKLHIRDRRRLERAACECYRTLKAHS